MRQKLSVSDQDFHDLCCPLKNTKSALLLVAFFSWNVFDGWKDLHAAPSHSGLFQLLFGIAPVAISAMLLVTFTCVRERLLLSFLIASLAAGEISGFFPAMIGPYIHAIRSARLVFGVVCLLVSLTMLVQSARTPKVEPNELQVAMAQELKRNFLIVVVLVLATLLLSAMLYFVPLRWWS